MASMWGSHTLGLPFSSPDIACAKGFGEIAKVLFRQNSLTEACFGGIYRTLTRLVGRQREQRILRSALESSEAELIAVYGRRRVGKTFLVREFFAEKVVFELTGVLNASLSAQLQSFATTLGTASRSVVPVARPADWQHAFQLLIHHLGATLR